MKNEVEGSFIPVKAYELVLPKDFKIDETAQFAATLPMKKGKKLEKTDSKSEKTKSKATNAENDANLEEINDDDSDIFGKPVIEKQLESAPPTTKLKPKETIKQSRPYSAKTAKVPSYLTTNPGKTSKEINDEESQKKKAQEFVANWLEKADLKRENSVKEFEKKLNPSSHFDNKLSDEINELMKKLNSTRKNTSKSIKNMKNTLKTPLNSSETSLNLVNNPFKSNIILKNLPKTDEKIEKKGLDLHGLYNTITTPNSWVPIIYKSTQAVVVSDDDSFVKDIEFDES